jgi:phosphoglucosamine mutase
VSSQPKLFGTDGIRGQANCFPVTTEIALRFGQAVAHEYRGENLPVIIGRDTRRSGPMLELAVASGIASMGCDVLLAGVIPTPAISYLTAKLPAAAGIVISASHNPFEDNGLKIFQRNGLKCTDEAEQRLTDLILGTRLDANRPLGSELGRIKPMADADMVYADMAQKHFGKGLDLTGLAIAVDAAHGAASKTTPAALRALGATVHVFNDQPDGCNINKDCGSNHPENISSHVKATGADIGIAHDGDADRVCVCDENGTILDGDEVLAIFGTDYMRRDALAKNTLVATLMSNMGLDECLAKAGATVLRSAVGDRYVFEKMIENQLNVGGEQSGHIILRDYSEAGDGLNTALQLLRVMRTTGKKLSELSKCMSKYPQLLINMPVREKRPVESMADVVAAIKSVEEELGREGRVFVRYSGTEPKIRLLIEAHEKRNGLKEMAERILVPIRAAIGASESA